MNPGTTRLAQLLAASSLAVVAGASAEMAAVAQPAQVGCVKAVGGEVPRSVSPWRIKLLSEWSEAEGQWRGRWQPAGDVAGHYRATFNKGRERAEAALQMTPLSSNQVRIVRTQSEGTCTYIGRVNPDGWHIAGTYTCTWAPGQILPWSAAIARGYQPDTSCPETIAPAPDPRLSVVWHETEGDWIGTWDPVQPVGDFRAGWHKGREWANANLHITLSGNTVQVIRSQAEGRCTYNGALLGNGWHVHGTYHCPWMRGAAQRWSATIGDGHPPS